MAARFGGNIGGWLLRAGVVAFLWIVVRTVFVISYDYPEATVTGRFFYLWKILPWGTLLAAGVLFFARNLRFSLKDLFVLFFLGWCALNHYHHDSIAENRLITLFLLGNLYFILRTFHGFWPRLVDATAGLILLSGIGEAVLGLKQIYGYAYSHHSLYSVTGSFFNPGPYGGYLAFVFAVALFYAYRKRAAWVDLRQTLRQKAAISGRTIGDLILWAVSGAALLLSVVVLPATLSRSAWVAVLGAATLFWLAEAGGGEKIRRIFRGKRRQIPWILLAAGLCCLLAFGVYSLKKGSADSRLWNWRITGKIVADHPVQGVGAGHYGGAYAQVQADHFRNNPDTETGGLADSPVYAFNEYLQIAAEQGLPGLVLFLVIILLCFRRFRSDPNGFQYGLTALLLFALTSYPFRVLPLAMLLVFVLAFSPHGIGLSRKRIVGAGIYGLILIGFGLLHGHKNDRREALSGAYREWKSIKMLYRMELYEDAATDYAPPWEELKQETEYLFEYGRSLNQAGQYEKSNEVLELGTRVSNDPMFRNVMGNNYKALGDWSSADLSYEEAFFILPDRIYPLYLRAKLSFEKGDTLEGLSRARRIVDFVPKVESSATKEMKAEMQGLLDSLQEYIPKIIMK
jgi:O-antigen ligase